MSEVELEYIRMRQSRFKRLLRIWRRPLHPVRVVFSLIGVGVFSIPFIGFYFKYYPKDFYLFIIYPLLFLVAHLVWFRLPFVKRWVRWVLFWLTLSIVVALGMGFLITVYSKQPFNSVSQWITDHLDISIRSATIYVIFPSLVVSALYAGVLMLALHVYREYRKRLYFRRFFKGK